MVSCHFLIRQYLTELQSLKLGPSLKKPDFQHRPIGAYENSNEADFFLLLIFKCNLHCAIDHFRTRGLLRNKKLIRARETTLTPRRVQFDKIFFIQNHSHFSLKR